MSKESFYDDKRNNQDTRIAFVVILFFIGFCAYLNSLNNTPEEDAVTKETKIKQQQSESDESLNQEIQESKKIEVIPITTEKKEYTTSNALSNKKAAPAKPEYRSPILTLGSFKLKDNTNKELTNTLKGLAQLINFKSGTDIIKRESTPAVDAIATSLKKHPKKHIQIGSHTNNTQPEAELLRVTNLRANKIKNELIKRGVKNTLTAQGFGSKEPLVSNKTAQGRYINRRIEFKILDK